jgi:hypothetical protein
MMRHIALTALKRCGGYLPGQDFMANRVEAKALVALGRAEYRKERAVEPEKVSIAEPVSDIPNETKPKARKPRKSKDSE